MGAPTRHFAVAVLALALAQASARSALPMRRALPLPTTSERRATAPRAARASPALSRALDVRGGGVVSDLWASYTTVLDEKPLVTKMFTSLTGFLLGDLLAQAFVEKKGANIEYKRLARMGSFGFFCHATTGHFFYNFLDSLLPAVTPLTVAAKVAIDQTCWAPVFMVMFFTYGCVFDGEPEKIAQKCKNDIFTAVKGSWATWVPAHTINFAFVPTEQRLLYINTIQIFFNIFMSMISSKKVDAPAPAKPVKA